MSEEWTEEQYRQVNAEMAEGVIEEVRQVLEHLGCCHGHDTRNTPPMFYPEMIVCAVRHATGKHDPRCSTASSAQREPEPVQEPQ